MKKLISIMLLATLATGIFSGCSKQETTQTDTGEEVVLKWVMPGPGKQSDADLVWAEFNKQLKTYEGMENITVDFEVIEAGDYVQKFMMAQTGGDKMDIIQTYTLDFVKEVRNETFAPLDEYLDDELKETKAELPEFVFEYGRVDDHIYSVTNYQMCPGMWALNINKEIADKYIDINELRAAAAKQEFAPEIFDIIEKLLEGAKANGDMGQGFSPYYATMLVSRTFDTVISNFAIDMYAEKPEIEEIHKTEEYKYLYDKMRDWYLKGYIRTDILSNDKVAADNGKAGGNIVYIENNYLGDDIVTHKSSKLDHYIVYLPANPLIPCTNAAGSLGISANSEHKEEAAKVINLMNCERGKDLYNLLVWGLEGKHYNKTGEDTIETIGYKTQAGSAEPYGLWKWIIGNTKNSWTTQTEAEGYKDFVFNKFNEGENTVQSKVLGIKVDMSKYQSGYSQISSVVKEYNNPLMYGAVENHEQVYNEFMQKLDACGCEEIKAEIQRQIDEFLASKN